MVVNPIVHDYALVAGCESSCWHCLLSKAFSSVGFWVASQYVHAGVDVCATYIKAANAMFEMYM
jgi:hypothetical protein